MARRCRVHPDGEVVRDRASGGVGSTASQRCWLGYLVVASGLECNAMNIRLRCRILPAMIG